MYIVFAFRHHDDTMWQMRPGFGPVMQITRDIHNNNHFKYAIIVTFP